MSSNIKWPTTYTWGERKDFVLESFFCLNEKLEILKDKENNLLNKKSELMSKCRHQSKHMFRRYLYTVIFNVRTLNKVRLAEDCKNSEYLNQVSFIYLFWYIYIYIYIIYICIYIIYIYAYKFYIRIYIIYILYISLSTFIFSIHST